MLADLFLSLAKKVVTAGGVSFSVASPAPAARILGGSLLAHFSAGAVVQFVYLIAP